MESQRLKCYSYRSTGMGAKSRAIVIKDFQVIVPTFIRRSRSGNHGEDCYSEDVIASADAIVFIEISNSRKHYCSVLINKFDAKLLNLIYKIHMDRTGTLSCPSLEESLEEQLAKAYNTR